MKCARCGGQLPEPPYFRKDTCPTCDADLRACVQCTFYAPDKYNECSESQAERQVDKERANVCDYFRTGDRAGTGDDRVAAAKAKLDSLFKK